MTESAATVRPVLAMHERCYFGTSGARDVELSVTNSDDLSFSYRILHLWRTDGDRCVSLFRVVSPRALDGTTLKLEEQPRSAALQLQLQLPSRNPSIIRVRADQRVLGSDLTYEDLRFWLPTDDIEFEAADRDIEGGSDCYVLSGRRISRVRGQGGVAMRIRLDAQQGRPLKIEWLANGSAPGRVLVSKDAVETDGVWVPQQLLVFTPGTGYQSALRLRRITLGIKIPEAFFSGDRFASLPTASFEGYTAARQ